MIIDTLVARFLLLLGLGFFFGLAFEEFHAGSNQARPGGIRSFPLLVAWCRDRAVVLKRWVT